MIALPFHFPAPSLTEAFEKRLIGTNFESGNTGRRDPCEPYGLRRLPFNPRPGVDTTGGAYTGSGRKARPGGIFTANLRPVLPVALRRDGANPHLVPQSQRQPGNIIADG